MRIKHNTISISRDNPFENCKLRREKYAKILTNIINNFGDGFVLSIDNEWGTGKTTFVRMWKQYLENNKFKTLYFNAWENDFEEDVLIALISELNELKTPATEELFKNLLSKTAPLAKSLAIGTLETLIKKYAGEGFAQECIKQTTGLIADELQKKVENYANKKNNITNFKKSLEEYVSSTDNKKSVIFIIDELDRCRPSYAVEVLERIKHLFSVPGIVFVLSIDKIQLGNAVRGVYGSDRINSDEYLRRFIDIEYSIPKPAPELFIEYIYSYFQLDEFFENSNRMQSPELRGDKSQFIDFTTLLFGNKEITLRLQEKIFAQVKIALCSFQDMQYVIPSLLVLLVYLKTKHPKIYANIKNKLYSVQELIDDIERILPSHIDEDNSLIFIHTEAMLIQSYNNSREGDSKEILIENTNSSEKRGLIYLVRTKLDSSLDNNKLARYFERSNFFSRISNMEITQLTSRIDLSEDIIIK